MLNLMERHMVNKREVLQAAGAAAVNGVLPAAAIISTAKAAETVAPAVKRIPLPPDPIKECERLAGELAKAMNAVRPGNYRVTIRHALGYVQIEDYEFRTEEEGPLVGVEAYEAWQEKRRIKRMLARA